MRKKWKRNQKGEKTWDEVQADQQMRCQERRGDSQSQEDVWASQVYHISSSFLFGCNIEDPYTLPLIAVNLSDEVESKLKGNHDGRWCWMGISFTWNVIVVRLWRHLVFCLQLRGQKYSRGCIKNMNSICLSGLTLEVSVLSSRDSFELSLSCFFFYLWPPKQWKSQQTRWKDWKSNYETRMFRLWKQVSVKTNAKQDDWLTGYWTLSWLMRIRERNQVSPHHVWIPYVTSRSSRQSLAKHLSSWLAKSL